MTVNISFVTYSYLIVNLRSLLVIDVIEVLVNAMHPGRSPYLGI